MECAQSGNHMQCSTCISATGKATDISISNLHPSTDSDMMEGIEGLEERETGLKRKKERERERVQKRSRREHVLNHSGRGHWMKERRRRRVGFHLGFSRQHECMSHTHTHAQMCI